VKISKFDIIMIINDNWVQIHWFLSNPETVDFNGDFRASVINPMRQHNSAADDNELGLLSPDKAS
jgi:hypothetical protein